MLEEKLYNLETYNYFLPKELIAQYPLKNRDESRLLVYKKKTKEITHHIFNELPSLLTKNDVLVLNNTKVIPARFYTETKNKKKVEILLVSPTSPDNLTWKVLASPRKHLTNVGALHATSLQQINVIDNETIRFQSHKDLQNILKTIGEMPLPPYIKRKQEEIDTERYQTIYAKEDGAVAAPTAGLHWTESILNKLKEKGIEIFYITLHVGPGTFLPVRTNDIREHKLIPEFFSIDESVWNKIIEAKKNKKRIIACGTTTVRALEYVGALRATPLRGLNGLYITPGFKFQIVDSMITNFHLPKTTLLILVSAFTGWENIKAIYEEAIHQKYRFYSYGDAMMPIID